MICNVPVCDSDIDEPIVIVPTSNTVAKEYVGTSEIDKPMNVQQYSIYHELDTGKNYYYDNGQWNEIPCCSGGGGDFSTTQVTFVIGNELSSFSYSASVDYPPVNLNTSSQIQYGTTDVIGNTTSATPLPEIDSTQIVNVLTYKGVAYISQYFTLYPYNSYDQIDVSGYTLSGAAETIEDEESLYYGMIKVTGECTITLTRE